MNAAGIAVAGQEVVVLREASDAELVAHVRAGDHAAFAELFRRYQPSVARFVRSRVRDHGRAEDVTQEAFVSALRRLHQTDSEIAFRAWIFEIARNASIDLYRRSSRTEEVSMDAAGGLPPADASRVGGTAGPDASMLRKESFDHFRGALEELSETHHRIIVMRELEGRSYREIGDTMDLSQAAVESTLFRARRKLEHEYAQLDSGRRCRVIGALIGRLAEGLDSDRDRLRLDRHARRCSACRRQARQMGVEPLLARRHRLAARAAAFLPLPAFLRRRGGGDPATGSGIHSGAGHIGVTFAPAFEAAGIAGKAVAVIAAAALIGGGGATLGGVGPLAVGGDSAISDQIQDRGTPDDRAPADPRATTHGASGGQVSPDGAAGGARDLLDAPATERPVPRVPQTPAPPQSESPPVEPTPALPPVGEGGGSSSGDAAAGLSVPPHPAVEQPSAPQLDMGSPATPAASAIGSLTSAEDAGAAVAWAVSGSSAK